MINVVTLAHSDAAATLVIKAACHVLLWQWDYRKTHWTCWMTRTTTNNCRLLHCVTTHCLQHQHQQFYITRPALTDSIIYQVGVYQWLNGLVVSALGIQARGLGFDSWVVPLFHWVATLAKLFTHIASRLSELQQTGMCKKREFSAPKWLWCGYGD